MTPPRILVAFGTRPEAIKLLPVITRLRDRRDVALTVVNSGQHRALLDPFLARFGLVPDIDLAVLRPGASLDALAASLLTRMGETLDRVRPGRVVVQGDTATAAMTALAAYHRRLPVAHVEAGLRTGDRYHPWPEEVNRRLIASVSDLHFAPTRTAAETILREGIETDRVIVTGNTVVDTLHAVRARLAIDPALAGAARALIARAEGRPIVLVTAHRRENLPHLPAIAEAVARLARRGDALLVVAQHARPEAQRVMAERLAGCANVVLAAPLDYPDFVALMEASHLVLTDSGGVQEEAPALGRPVLVLRETTERPEGLIAGTARLVGTDPDRIVREAAALLDDPCVHGAMARAHSPFGDGQAAARIVAALTGGEIAPFGATAAAAAEVGA